MTMEQHALLSRTETAVLLDQARSGDEAAVERIVIHNQRLAYKIAHRYYLTGFCGDLELEDIVQWANIGLLKAIRRYDPDSGCQFSTYATHWINGTIRRHARCNGSIKLYIRDAIRLSKIRSAIVRLIQDTGNESPNVLQISLYTGINQDVIAELMPAIQHEISLDVDSSKDIPIYELIPDTSDDTESLETANLRRLVQALPSEYREIINRRYLSRPAETASEVGRALNIPRQKVTIMEMEAIEMLKEMNLNSRD